MSGYNNLDSNSVLEYLGSEYLVNDSSVFYNPNRFTGFNMEDYRKGPAPFYIYANPNQGDAQTRDAALFCCYGTVLRVAWQGSAVDLNLSFAPSLSNDCAISYDHLSGLGFGSVSDLILLGVSQKGNPFVLSYNQSGAFKSSYIFVPNGAVLNRTAGTWSTAPRVLWRGRAVVNYFNSSPALWTSVCAANEYYFGSVVVSNQQDFSNKWAYCPHPTNGTVQSFALDDGDRLLTSMPLLFTSISFTTPYDYRTSGDDLYLFSYGVQFFGKSFVRKQGLLTNTGYTLNLN